MTWLKTFLRILWSTLWYGFAAFVLVWAIAFGVIRLSLPFADYYKADASAYISEYLGQTLSLESVDAEWHGWGPSVVFNDVALMDAAGEKPVLKFAKLRFGFDSLQSLAQWDVVFSHITLVGATLKIIRDDRQQISLAGFGNSAETPAADVSPEILERFTGWFFSQGQVSLEDSQISWQDEAGSGRELNFSAVNMTLRNGLNHHVLNASITLPEVTGSALNLMVDMKGDPRHFAGRDTRVFVEGKKLRLRDLFDPQTLSDRNLDVERADFQLWGQWQEGQLISLQGNLDSHQLALSRPIPENNSETVAVASNLALERLAGKFQWRLREHGWQLEADELVLARQGREWQPTRASLEYRKMPDQDAELKAAMGSLELDDVAYLISFFQLGGERLLDSLDALRPRGRLTAARLQIHLNETRDFSAYGELEDAAVEHWKSVPEARAVKGKLWLSRERGYVSLEQAAVTLQFPDLFRGPIPIDTLRGELAWRVSNDVWRLTGRNLIAQNEDISARAILDVVKDDAEQSPFMSLIAQFENGNGSQVARYLPANIMPQRTVDWLDNGIVEARLVAGGAVFNGRLKHFPFDTGDGRFEVRFQVEDAELNYAEDWPVLMGVAAEVQFLGRGMRVNAHQGKILSNDIERAEVHIPDMTRKPLLMTIRGDVQGATQDKLDYLAASPTLREKFGRYLGSMKTLGASELHLDIGLAIGKPEDNRVAGWLEMQQNEITLDTMGQVANGVSGRLNFNQRALEAERLDARLFGEEAVLTVHTDDNDDRPGIRIRAQGMMNASTLATRFLPSMSEYFSGLSPWDVSLFIPGKQKNSDDTLIASLRAVSELNGVAIKLPAPLSKSAETTRPSTLRVDFETDRPPQLHLAYNNELDARVELSEKSGPIRADIRINKGLASLSREAGIRIQGSLDQLILDDWRALWGAGDGEETAVAGSNSPLLTNIRNIDLHAQLLQAYGQTLNDIHLVATPLNGSAGPRLIANVKSRELSGTITIPYDLSEQPIVARFSEWLLNEPELGEGSLDPRSIPSLDIQVKNFRYKDKQLGNMHFETSRVTEGLRIEQLLLKPVSTTITMRGGWYVRADAHQSSIHLNLSSRNIGRTLTALGYVGGIENGKGAVEAELNWADSLANVDAKNLNGQVKMKLSEGQLLDVDPGAGRLFSLLSLQTLPRRLLLDFSDVFKKGFGFDHIEGTFTIADGDAYTNDFLMDGSSARIDIAGRIGLETEDYDQTVTVTPRLSDTLPVIGALAATPQIGAAILFAQKIFKLEIDDVTRTQYAITGEWSDPKIRKLKKAPSGSAEE